MWIERLEYFPGGWGSERGAQGRRIYRQKLSLMLLIWRRRPYQTNDYLPRLLSCMVLLLIIEAVNETRAGILHGHLYWLELEARRENTRLGGGQRRNRRTARQRKTGRPRERL